jgi:hypothetical protein
MAAFEFGIHIGMHDDQFLLQGYRVALRQHRKKGLPATIQPACGVGRSPWRSDW